MPNSSVRAIVPGRIKNQVYERANGTEYVPVGSFNPKIEGTLLASNGSIGAATPVVAIANYDTWIMSCKAIMEADARIIQLSIAGIGFEFGGDAPSNDPAGLGLAAADGSGLSQFPPAGQLLDIQVRINTVTGDITAYINGSVVATKTGTGPNVGTGNDLQYTEDTTHGTGANLVVDFELRGV